MGVMVAQVHVHGSFGWPAGLRDIRRALVFDQELEVNSCVHYDVAFMVLCAGLIVNAERGYMFRQWELEFLIE